MAGREAKITPTKIGQFVTLWKRSAAGPIQPFDADDFDLYVVRAHSGTQSGYFVFPASLLVAQGVVASENRDGKRALRVYPPWDKPTSRQAQKTQNWQTPYFLTVSENNVDDRALVERLILPVSASNL